jgi:hypothetical protein
MSTTTPAPVSAGSRESDPASPPAGPRPARLAAPAALVLGGLMYAAGMGLHLPAMPEDVGITEAIADGPSRWMSSHLLMSFGLVLVAAALVSALPLVRGRGVVATSVGAVLTSLGAVVLAFSDMAHGALGFALADPVDPATSFEIHVAFFEQPAIAGLMTGPPFLTVGMIVLGAGLLRSGAVARWRGIAVLLTPIGVLAGLNLVPSTWLHGVPFVVGMVVLASVIAQDQRPSRTAMSPPNDDT